MNVFYVMKIDKHLIVPVLMDMLKYQDNVILAVMNVKPAQVQKPAV